ncbi:twin-arginine translocase subunit TatB [Agrobacterium tumefaciens]|uniref:Sec-independent protein translocase protein TatB n=1 Tax=Agrobacterium tumefaciens TaxID=358 RepID=A0AAP9E303_AGRTU|nr:Sec-independent protein translocase protein TatB [Agrobacterium tumefaciens]NSZ57728.1 twin-arginine translocase subunit TatB [Agrobacterium tumefaciens]QDY93849.1 twin-arginine translocase subunit TatB [Agrobacterium tumefaciens]UXS48919.1 twin-arginine translocase subunit TatB [Agrobacterium tumefaciens]UXS70223.1 twin-arginine translocase subunit TatB [Agrobacterium tumefaciens]UXS77887.1 twin-arginine translocase subunit TatB [Agrobacterium tumefaciens]
MFDIGWSELLVIAVVLIVVVGPKDLPPMIRAFGKTMAGLRKMAGDFRTQFDEALKEADMDDVRQTISDVRNLNPTNSLRDAMNPLRQLGNEIKSDLQKATAAPDGLSSTPAPATSEPVAPLVSVPEPEMKLPDAPPVVAAPAAPVAAAVAAEEKPKRARAKSIATVEAEAVAAKPKRAARSKVAAAPETAVTVKTSEPAVKTVAKKAAVRKSSADKAAVADAKPAKTAKTKAAKPTKDEA